MKKLLNRVRNLFRPSLTPYAPVMVPAHYILPFVCNGCGLELCRFERRSEYPIQLNPSILEFPSVDPDGKFIDAVHFHYAIALRVFDTETHKFRLYFQAGIVSSTITEEHFGEFVAALKAHDWHEIVPITGKSWRELLTEHKEHQQRQLLIEEDEDEDDEDDEDMEEDGDEDFVGEDDDENYP